MLSNWKPHCIHGNFQSQLYMQLSLPFDSPSCMSRIVVAGTFSSWANCCFISPRVWLSKHLRVDTSPLGSRKNFTVKQSVAKWVQYMVRLLLNWDISTELKVTDLWQMYCSWWHTINRNFLKRYILYNVHGFTVISTKVMFMQAWTVKV